MSIAETEYFFEGSRCAIDPQEQQFDGYKWGLLGGYKQFFTPKFGLRYLWFV